MKSSGTDNYTDKVKKEPTDRCYNVNDEGETKVQTFDTKNLQHIYLQENTIYTLEELKGINEYQPNQDIKIEFECEDVKPNAEIRNQM
uniref:Uncharacterized protein n=1 Tax=Trichogramma kaykai TaxID=54128 RepID=A0ABD2XD06_9HYME